jgi:glycosyltransferase involved in cell wall biosynthesis
MSQSYSFYRRLNGVFGHRLADRAAGAVVARPAPRLLCAMRYGALGASSRLRLAQYRPYLEQAGISTAMRSFLADDYLQALYGNTSRFGAVARAYGRAFGAPLAARANDVLWIEKEFLPWLPYALERRAIGDTPYILDFDDAWSLRYEQSNNPLVRLLLGDKFRRLLRGAALTVTANETLFAWARAEGAGQVLKLPTVIDLDLYRPRPAPDGPFTIGWVGTPLTAGYLEVIAGPLKTLAAEAPLRLLVIGAPALRVEGVECVHRPWSAASEADDLAACHVGIMPLPDDDWARGKSGYKIIQYMAMARPAVASAIGANNQIIAPGETGFLASTPAEWLTHLRALRDDPALRERLGAAARLRVERQFSLQVTAPILIAHIKTILATL